MALEVTKYDQYSVRNAAVWDGKLVQRLSRMTHRTETTMKIGKITPKESRFT